MILKKENNNCRIKLDYSNENGENRRKMESEGCN